MSAIGGPPRLRLGKNSGAVQLGRNTGAAEIVQHGTHPIGCPGCPLGGVREDCRGVHPDDYLHFADRPSMMKSKTISNCSSVQ